MLDSNFFSPFKDNSMKKILIPIAGLLILAACHKDLPEPPKTKHTYLVKMDFTSTSNATDFTVIYTDHEGVIQTLQNACSEWVFTYHGNTGDYILFTVNAAQLYDPVTLVITLDGEVWKYESEDGQFTPATVTLAGNLP
jgi:hypothetical protein